MMQQLIQLYQQTYGFKPVRTEALTPAGSNRRYFRLYGSPTVIGVVGTSKEENQAFIALANHFFQLHLPVPKLLAVSNDASCYLQQDLGSVALFDALADGRNSGQYSADAIALLEQTISELPRFQFLGGKDFDFSVCYPLECFDKRSIDFDLNYFKYCYLKLTGIEFNEVKLDVDFQLLAQHLLKVSTGSTFMYRDFQARNVMLFDGKPFFIDFQGGRRGPIFYDVASFLWQAKACYPQELREHLIDIYLIAAEPFVDIDVKAFRNTLRHFVLFRLLQVLGAYGFRGLHEHKPHFIQSIPYALNNLRELLTTPFDDYPYLNELLTQLVAQKTAKEEKVLEVEVISFSFKNGYPYDASGNGGGYIFDCRALHNPGRYDAYKQLTGQDAEVIDFLQQYDEVETFITHAFALVEAHVQRYQQRGFTHLQVAFGCTGGQHRSVYCAEQMAKRLHERFEKVAIKVVHREQKITYTLS
ncbi:MAG: RNase adapter RapZ [Bacteroidales bacterium]|nr:RNase adapter RapZ [Bacteroidales bacterium]